MLARSGWPKLAALRLARLRLARLRLARLWLASLHGWRADLAALGLGALAAAALPPIHAVPVLLLAVPGLLALIDAAAGPLGAARRGWWFGFGHNLLGLYWVTEAILVEAARFWWLVPLAVPALAAVMALFIAAPAALARLARRGWPRALALAGGWVLADLARQFIATGFPWNPWGSVWELPGWAGDVMIQPAAWIGAPGLTFLTVLLAALPALGWRWRTAGAALLAGWVVLGVVRLRAPLPPPPGVKVVLLQGDIAEGQKWEPRPGGADLRPLPRPGAGGCRTGRPGSRRGGLAGDRQPVPAATRRRGARGDRRSGRAGDQPGGRGAASIRTVGRATACLPCWPTARRTAIYDKWHLVPFGEYQPSWFPLPIQVVPGGGFASGPGPRTLHLPGLPPVGPLICYEAIFPGQVVDAADRPAWLVNITNDAWFGNSTGPRQHLAAARLRAVEEGLPLVRAANTGISAAFDPRGHELARLGMNRTGVVVVDLPAALPPTLFARLGLWIPGLLGAVALGLGLVADRGAALGPRRPENPAE